MDLFIFLYLSNMAVYFKKNGCNYKIILYFDIKNYKLSIYYLPKCT